MLSFNEETHTYKYNGTVVPSVTQITSRIAVRETDDAPWTSLSGKEFIIDAETSGNFGNEFHKIPAIILTGGEPDYDPAFKPWVSALWNFLNDHDLVEMILALSKLKVNLVEQQLYSFLGYAGTMDWFYDNNKTLRIIDWKTSAKINLKTTRMQTAAYANLIRETLGLRSNAKIERWTVRIDPTLKRGYEVDKRCSEPEDWNNFLSCLNVYNNFKN